MMQAVAVSGGMWHIELQRPEKRNALGVEAYTLLANVLRQIGAMPDARVVVLSGQGKAFFAGNDLAEFAAHWPQPPGGPVVRFLEALTGLPCPWWLPCKGLRWASARRCCCTATWSWPAQAPFSSSPSWTGASRPRAPVPCCSRFGSAMPGPWTCC